MAGDWKKSFLRCRKVCNTFLTIENRPLELSLKAIFLKFWFPVIMYAMFIFWISSQEQPFGIKLKIVGLDKVAHIAEYAIFGFLIARALLGSLGKIPAVTLVFTVFIIGTLYGITDEFHQYFTPGRTVSFLDLLSDSIGSFLGAIIFAAFTPLEKAADSNRRSSPPKTGVGNR